MRFIVQSKRLFYWPFPTSRPGAILDKSYITLLSLSQRRGEKRNIGPSSRIPGVSSGKHQGGAAVCAQRRTCRPRHDFGRWSSQFIIEESRDNIAALAARRGKYSSRRVSRSCGFSHPHQESREAGHFVPRRQERINEESEEDGHLVQRPRERVKNEEEGEHLQRRGSAT